MCIPWETFPWLVVAWLLAGCNSSPSTPPPPAPAIGATLVPPLSGVAASNQANCVEHLRHLPKMAAFEARTFTNRAQAQIRYLLFAPQNYQTNQAYPVVLSLHGGAPRRNFEDLLEPYLPGLAYGLGRLVSAETQNSHPSFVVAPWSNNQAWDEPNLALVMDLLEALQREFSMDPKRRYVTGQSMGGFGTWSVIASYPGYFAAAIPICGGGDPKRIARPWRTPIRAFHGTTDQVVPVHYSREMVAAVRSAGGHPLYFEYENTEHAGAAERAYCEPDLISWLFAQSLP
jgi:predicted peptidase